MGPSLLGCLAIGVVGLLALGCSAARSRPDEIFLVAEMSAPCGTSRSITITRDGHLTQVLRNPCAARPSALDERQLSADDLLELAEEINAAHFLALTPESVRSEAVSPDEPTYSVEVRSESKTYSLRTVGLASEVDSPGRVRFRKVWNAVLALAPPFRGGEVAREENACSVPCVAERQ